MGTKLPEFEKGKGLRMINKMNAAVIGCGMISDTYLQSMQQFSILQVTACCDLDKQRAEVTADKFGICARNLEDILNDDGIELIINLTSPSAHYAITKQALEAGKHVYSEKMIAVEWEEGKELCRIAEKQKKRLGAAPDTFLGAGIQTAGYLAAHGMIGEVTSAVISLNKDFTVFGDILPHLNRRGGGILFDSACYYLTALVHLLGPVKKVTGFTKISRPERENKRVGDLHYGEKKVVECENIAAGALQFESGATAAFHFNADSILNETFRFELYGTHGILELGDPNLFGGKVYLQKPLQKAVEMPFTHGYQKQARGIGAAEMAWAIRQNRPHRAGMEQALHVFEIIHGIMKSAQTGKVYDMETSCSKSKALREGYVDNGAWGPTEERALAEWE